VEAIVLPKLMKSLPMRSLNIDKSRWQNYPLADPEFNKPGQVNLIIGADLYAKILSMQSRE